MDGRGCSSGLFHVSFLVIGIMSLTHKEECCKFIVFNIYYSSFIFKWIGHSISHEEVSGMFSYNLFLFSSTSWSTWWLPLITLLFWSLRVEKTAALSFKTVFLKSTAFEAVLIRDSCHWQQNKLKKKAENRKINISSISVNSWLSASFSIWYPGILLVWGHLMRVVFRLGWCLFGWFVLLSFALTHSLTEICHHLIFIKNAHS